MSADVHPVPGKIRAALKWSAVVIAAALATLLAVRAYDASRGPDLRPWHTYVPDELEARDLQDLNWAEYVAAEQSLFEEMRAALDDKLEVHDRVATNRYFSGSPLNGTAFAQDWNRSFILEPSSQPIGAVVLFHGLTDSPYSVRHIARFYREQGYVAVAIRMPGHGTVPGALARIEWQDWVAASRIAVRTASERIGKGGQLHVVGYSNGGALALKYALDATEDASLPTPDRVVLMSPMIGLTRMASFAGVLGWPAVFPAFAKAAWLDVLPEFNPFKYNSFPVNGARQSSLFTAALQKQIARMSKGGRLAGLPPVLTFQSVLDNTVSTQAVVRSLYAHLPANGSELVLFDLNHNAEIGILLRAQSGALAEGLLTAAPRKFRATIVTNAGSSELDVYERVTEAGSTTVSIRQLGLEYPRDAYSLSHIALPFPPQDSLYGSHPDTAEHFGLHLGTLATRGERASLIVSLDTLTRMSSNPFFSYMIDRMNEGVATPGQSQ